jgi:bacillithiol biosynthesis deacetylase BshB1
MMDAACIGAHPDDVEIGMGATVAGMVREGLRVAILDLTDGEPTPMGTRETRLREAQAAAEVLGVSTRRTLSLPNRSLYDTVEARRELAEVLRELRPRLLFAPYPVDAHPDHISACAIVEAARFWAKFVKTDLKGTPHYPAKVYHYLAVHLRLHVKPSFVIDVTPDLETKLRSLRCYASQFVANPANAGILERLEREAGYWGSLIGTRHGEPFFCREEVGISSVTHLL